LFNQPSFAGWGQKTLFLEPTLNFDRTHLSNGT